MYARRVCIVYRFFDCEENFFSFSLSHSLSPSPSPSPSPSHSPPPSPSRPSPPKLLLRGGPLLSRASSFLKWPLIFAIHEQSYLTCVFHG